MDRHTDDLTRGRKEKRNEWKKSSDDIAILVKHFHAISGFIFKEHQVAGDLFKIF